nr:unnamed protein product [Callosobruchus chinensis]
MSGRKGGKVKERQSPVPAGQVYSFPWDVSIDCCVRKLRGTRRCRTVYLAAVGVGRTHARQQEDPHNSTSFAVAIETTKNEQIAVWCDDPQECPT